MTHPTHNTPWMQTYTGRQSWPLNIDDDGLNMLDAAHSLSMQCRYAGHCIKFLSVAEHLVHCYRAAKLLGHRPAVQKAALFHDVPEYLLVDVPRAVKPELKGYRELEDGLARRVARRYGVEYPWPAEVIEIDNRILLDERAQNMTRFLSHNDYHMLDDLAFLVGQINTPAGYGHVNEEESGWPFHLQPLNIELQFWMPWQAEMQFLDAYEECKDY